jgi:hypothetical protein
MAMPELQDAGEERAGEVQQMRRPLDRAAAAAHARAARTRAKHERWMTELIGAGFHVVTPEIISEGAAKLDAYDHDDPESAHGEADTVLFGVAPAEITAAWAALENRCDGFWYA